MNNNAIYNKNMKEEKKILVETKYFTFAYPPDKMVFENGFKLGPITIAYETYGNLNKEKTNAILIFHVMHMLLAIII